VVQLLFQAQHAQDDPVVPGATAGNGERYGGDITPSTIVQELIPHFASSDLPLRVVDGDQVLGAVDRSAVMAALVEEH